MTPGTVELKNAGMRYRIYRERATTLKEAAVHLFRHLRTAQDFWALRDIELRVRPGEAVGLIGANGSGKSTLLKLVAGVMEPTTGSVEVAGRISPMIELGAGFDPELTGRENVFLNGALLGFSRRQMEKKFDGIVEFAELRDFIEVPVKNYSSGMHMRLGFAVAVDVDPQILIVDEILAVGDEHFQKKCMERIDAFRKSGVTILYVSHAMDTVERLCDRAVLLNHGQVLLDGRPREVIARYHALAQEPGAAAPAAQAAAV
jgi:ABC-type polysaccharide/polyol phosphate transport system ATPase subunit